MRSLHDLRRESADDRVAFLANEYDELLRRWRLIGAIALVMIVAGEILPLLIPSFPPNLVLSATEAAAVSGAYVLARMRASRRALEVATILVGAWTGVYAGITVADGGGYQSVHMLGMAVVIVLTPSAFPLARGPMLATTVGSLITFFASCTFALDHRGASLAGIDVAAFYVAFLAVFVTLTAERARSRRYREFLALRIAERLQRMVTRHHAFDIVRRQVAAEHFFDGEAVEAPPERRIVTVLFGDVAGFTPFSEKLPPEALASFMARFYDQMAQAAFAHGATIDKFIGDAVMAILGAPEPMDPAAQATRALALARAWHDRVGDLVAGDNETLKLRIGIHQDAVAVGTFGGRLRSDYTVLGRGVNIAARLEQRCRHGEILLSEAVYAKLVDKPDDIVEVGMLELKGIPDQQRCYAVALEPRTKAA
jgi:class 3 adenylate cyclase